MNDLADAGKTNPTCRGVASGEAGTNPISKAKTSGFYGYFLAQDRRGRQAGFTVYGKSEFIYLW